MQRLQGEVEDQRLREMVQSQSRSGITSLPSTLSVICAVGNLVITLKQKQATPGSGRS